MIGLLIFWLPNLGWKWVERIVLLDKEPWDWFHVLKSPDVLQNYQQVAVGHHEGRWQHGVAPPVPHHPQRARPDEEDKRQPADICDAPRLTRTNHRGFFMKTVKLLTMIMVSCLYLSMMDMNSKYPDMNG